MRKIAVLNQKGGVGKTTTTVNLGACLVELGRKVLLVDIDSQANLSTHLALEVERGEPSIYTLVRGEHSLDEVVRDTVMEGLKVIPANIDLAGLEVELATETWGRELCLARALEGLEERFDYVLLDCPPSLGLVTLNVMCAVNEIFIPLQTEFFALQGLSRLAGTVALIRSGLNPQVDITGIVSCMFDKRTSLATEVLNEIKQHFGDKMFKTVVRKNIRLAEAPSFGVPIVLYDPMCYGAQDYRSLAREVLAMAAARPQVSPAPVRVLGTRPEPPVAMAG